MSPAQGRAEPSGALAATLEGPKAPLGLHEELPPRFLPEVETEERLSCTCGPERLRLRSEHGELVKPRGGSVNRCAYCARLAAVENCEMLAIDAMEGVAPSMLLVLGTRTVTVEMDRFADGHRYVRRALRKRWPEFEVASLLEFTTGYGARSGGQRRPHWNYTIKGVPADAAVRVYHAPPARPRGRFLAATIAAADGLVVPVRKLRGRAGVEDVERMRVPAEGPAPGVLEERRTGTAPSGATWWDLAMAVPGAEPVATTVPVPVEGPLALVAGARPSVVVPVLSVSQATGPEALHAVAAPVWCAHVDAERHAQHATSVYAAGGLMRYLALHFQKASQEPPAGFTGQRFNCSVGYFADSAGTRATARARAQSALRRKRIVWRIENRVREDVRRAEGLDDGHAVILTPEQAADLEIDAGLAHRRDSATRWQLAHECGAPASPVIPKHEGRKAWRLARDREAYCEMVEEARAHDRWRAVCLAADWEPETQWALWAEELAPDPVEAGEWAEVAIDGAGCQAIVDTSAAVNVRLAA